MCTALLTYRALENASIVLTSSQFPHTIMRSPSSKSSMSLGELAACEDFLDGHREYAIDLLSSIERIQEWHSTNSCPGAREGRTCMLCEICSIDGLMGATKKALVSYGNVENRLKAVRASFGKSIPSRGTCAYRAESITQDFSEGSGAWSRNRVREQSSENQFPLYRHGRGQSPIAARNMASPPSCCKLVLVHTEFPTYRRGSR